MSALQIPTTRTDAAAIGASIAFPRTAGISPVSSQLAQILSGLNAVRTFDRFEAGAFSQSTTTGASELRRVSRVGPAQGSAGVNKGLEEQLYDALASFKVRTATIAMHIDREWRDRLFKQLDSLLSAEDWQSEDPTPTLASFSTFIRMLLFLKPERRPGLGATNNGHLIAAWTVGNDRLTMECLPNDFVRWHLSAMIDGDREKAAAESPIQRLSAVLAPYTPSRWFSADHVP
jgi:hypothetical protein